MYTSYSRGCDLPPLMRDSLLADETAAAAFNALGPAAQDEAVRRCGAMSSQAEIDEFIRQTDNFLVSELYSPEGDSALM